MYEGFVAIAKERDIAGDRNTRLVAKTVKNLVERFYDVWADSHSDRNEREARSWATKIVAMYDVFVRDTEKTGRPWRVPNDWEMRTLLEWVCRPGRTVGDLQLEVLYIFTTFFKIRTSDELDTVLLNHVALMNNTGEFVFQSWATKTLKAGTLRQGQFKDVLMRRQFPRQFNTLKLYMLLREREPKSNLFFVRLKDFAYARPLYKTLLAKKKSPAYNPFIGKKFTNTFRRAWLYPKLYETGEIDGKRGGVFQNKSLRGHRAEIEQELGIDTWGSNKQMQRSSQYSYAHQNTRIGRRLFSNYPPFYAIARIHKHTRIGQFRDIALGSIAKQRTPRSPDFIKGRKNLAAITSAKRTTVLMGEPALDMYGNKGFVGILRNNKCIFVPIEVCERGKESDRCRGWAPFGPTRQCVTTICPRVRHVKRAEPFQMEGTLYRYIKLRQLAAKPFGHGGKLKTSSSSVSGRVYSATPQKKNAKKKTPRSGGLFSPRRRTPTKLTSRKTRKKTLKGNKL